MGPSINPMLTPIVQYGFAGLCAIQFAFIFWLTRRLLDVLRKNSEVIAANTAAIQRVDERTGDSLKLLRELNNQLLSRPCQAKR